MEKTKPGSKKDKKSSNPPEDACQDLNYSEISITELETEMEKDWIGKLKKARSEQRKIAMEKEAARLKKEKSLLEKPDKHEKTHHKKWKWEKKAKWKSREYEK